MITADHHAARLEAAARLAGERELAALLVGFGSDLLYLTGYEAMPLERLTMLVVAASGDRWLVVPRLERTPALASAAAAAGLVEVVGWDETESPHEIVANLVARSRSGGGTGAVGVSGAVGVAGAATIVPPAVAVSDQLWASHVLRLQAAMPGVAVSLGSTVLGELRVRKDADEIALLRTAAAAADRVVDAIAAGRLIGRTEADVSREVEARLLAEGHETADFAIVASGPNSASPHHDAGERVIRAGEPIVLDIGGAFSGYRSDTTRTLWPTGGDPAAGPDDAFVHLYGVLQAAQSEASHAVHPGVPAERIDAVAREIISNGGYGPQFFHRTGHGIGLETHEDPYIVAGNATLLEPGMAFSVEPGIYFEGHWGARIEDIVVCTADGVEVLNRTSRALRVVDGRGRP